MWGGWFNFIFSITSPFSFGGRARTFAFFFFTLYRTEREPTSTRAITHLSTLQHSSKNLQGRPVQVPVSNMFVPSSIEMDDLYSYMNSQSWINPSLHLLWHFLSQLLAFPGLRFWDSTIFPYGWAAINEFIFFRKKINEFITKTHVVHTKKRERESCLVWIIRVHLILHIETKSQLLLGVDWV